MTYRWEVTGSPRVKQRKGVATNKRESIRNVRHWLRQMNARARGQVWILETGKLLYQANWTGKKIIIEEL